MLSRCLYVHVHMDLQLCAFVSVSKEREGRVGRTRVAPFICKMYICYLYI